MTRPHLWWFSIGALVVLTVIVLLSVYVPGWSAVLCAEPREVCAS